jgi:DNA-binding GntR family transcriptional regulator
MDFIELIRECQWQVAESNIRQAGREPKEDAVEESGTRTEQVYRRLKADILTGQIEPGAALPFAKLKEDYVASMGVLREALMRLTAEGLTVNQPQFGFRVISLSLEDLTDLTGTRCTIESMVLRDAVTNGDLDWETRVLAAHHRMERTKKFEGGDGTHVTLAWAQAHQEFHEALLSGARSLRMQAIASNLRAAAEVYRQWSIPFEVVRRDVSAEHREIVDLALARNANEAMAALVRHLSATRDLILKGTQPPRQ